MLLFHYAHPPKRGALGLSLVEPMTGSTQLNPCISRD